MSSSKTYEVAIIGAGVCGTSLLYTLSQFTNIKNIVLLEKNSDVALVNSHCHSNSQTLHFGDIETNYTLAKAQKVKQAADLVKNYLLKYDSEQAIHTKYHKMVLGVNKLQAKALKQRYQEFKTLFPHLQIIDAQQINQLEPKVLEGRDNPAEILALFTPEGFAVDFQKLSQSFLAKSQNLQKNIAVQFNTKVKKIEYKNDFYYLYTGEEKIVSKVVIACAGAHSLLLAKSLNYGKNYALLCVAGSFYFAPQLLRGKVYTVQQKKLPFAAIHGDPEVHNPNLTRFGPTAKVLPMLERYNYSSILEYLQTAGLNRDAIASFINILADPVVFKYILKNFLYDLPGLGKVLFAQEVKKIIPTIKLNQLKFAHKYGGIRPQIVNLKTKSLQMGEAKIIGDNIIFNITPSPGASTCLQNALEDTEKVINFLGDSYSFDRKKFIADLSGNDTSNMQYI